MSEKKWVAPGLWLWFLILSSVQIRAQDGKILDDFRGTASITNNGISLVPSFSLGDPALLFDLKFTKGRLSFEPDMRFAQHLIEGHKQLR